MICYLIFSVLIAAAAFTVRRRSLLRLTGAAFYACLLYTSRCV